MISAVVSTHESERSLVPTLSALVPGVTAGLLGEVVVADAGSTDATAQVAEVAGCRFVASSEPLGVRLKAAAASTRGPWLMFLRSGTVLEPGWVGIVERFIERAGMLDGSARAAVFRPPGFADLMRPGLAELLAMLRATLGGGPKPDQGLLIARALYDEIGGHRPDDNADAGLLRRLGRRRIAMLPAGASVVVARKPRYLT
jgi:glycosyltransferase involved in cell wall biosynthesis